MTVSKGAKILGFVSYTYTRDRLDDRRVSDDNTQNNVFQSVNSCEKHNFHCQTRVSRFVDKSVYDLVGSFRKKIPEHIFKKTMSSHYGNSLC